MTSMIFEQKHRILVVVAALAALVAAYAQQTGLLADNAPQGGAVARAALDKTVNGVTKRWPDLAHIKTDAVAAKLSTGELVLIDARSDEEFAVSHIKGAQHVLPDTTAADFQSRFGDQIAGKDVVFYCAVGVRSSTLATRVASVLKEKGARSVSNMAGGIFAWHNEARPLVDTKGATQSVHSYDKWWGRLVARPEQIQNKP